MSALDWVLDPANNAIKYKDKSGVGVLYQSRWMTTQTDWHSTPESACMFTLNLLIANTSPDNKWSFVSTNGSRCYYSRVSGAYELMLFTKQGTNDYKSIPIPIVSDKIYDNAKTDSASASIVNDAVKEYVNEGSADVALDAAKADADTTHN